MTTAGLLIHVTNHQQINSLTNWLSCHLNAKMMAEINFNRMHDTLPNTRMASEVFFGGQEIYQLEVAIATRSSGLIEVGIKNGG